MTPRAPLACAAALAALIAVALAQQLCETTQFGSRSSAPVSRPVRRVEPGLFTLEINDPDVCRESAAVGLRVTACDADTAPRVLLLDAARGLVVRAGALAGAAHVYCTVYCAAAEPDPAEPAADYTEDPGADTSLTTTTSPTPPLSLSTQDTPPISNVEPADEYLPPIKLESRFSSSNDFKSPLISNGLSSRLKDLWKDRVTSTWFQENQQSFLNKAKHPPIFDPYSTFSKSFPKSSSPSLAKRLTDLRPKQQDKWLANRAPSWKRRPTRRPSSPWLKLRSLSHDETRKATSLSRRRAVNAFDYNDPWSPYEDDPLSLHWTDDPIDSIRYTEGDSQSDYKNNFAWRIKPPKTHNWNEGPHSASHLDRPSSSSIKHVSKKQSRFVPSIQEEDPALLMELKKKHTNSKRPALPKLLLLLQDQEPEETVQKKCPASAHSVEDTDSWWLNKPNKQNEDEGIPWQPDYPEDYTADGGDARSYSSWNYIDDRIQSSYVAPTKKQAPTWPPRYRATPPANLVNARLVPHASHKPPDNSKAPPFENYFYYSPMPLTERPLLTSTVRNTLPWIQNSNSMPLISPMKLKKPSPKKLLQKSNHHYPQDHNYPPDHRFPTKPLVPAENNYPPETYNPSHLRPGSQLPPGLQLPTGPHYLTETYSPSHLQPNPFSDVEHFQSDPYYPSNAYNPSEPYSPLDLGKDPELHNPLEYNYPFENHLPSGPQFPSEPDYLSELGNVPPEPLYPSGYHFPPKPNFHSESGKVPSEPHYPSEPRHPPERHYPPGHRFPSKPKYLSESGNVPSEPHYLLDPRHPPELHYPSGHHFQTKLNYPSESGNVPSEPYTPAEPNYPSEPAYPSELENVPPEPHYPSGHYFPSEADYPLGSDYPADLDYPSGNHYSPEPHHLKGPHLPSGPSHIPSDPDYPSQSHYPPEPVNFPSKPRYPPETHYPTAPQYPPDSDYPNEPDYLSEPEPHYPLGPHVTSEPLYPSKHHYPPKHHNPPRHHQPPKRPSGPRYPSAEQFPSGSQRPSESKDLSQYLQSTAPWEYLSELLLSHPSFRDSTHVIRIR